MVRWVLENQPASWLRPGCQERSVFPESHSLLASECAPGAFFQPAGRQAEGLAAPGQSLEILADAQAVELAAGELEGALAFRQVLDLDPVGEGEEAAGSLGRVTEAVGGLLAEQVPDDHQQLPGNGHHRLAASQAGRQAGVPGLPARLVDDPTA